MSKRRRKKKRIVWYKKVADAILAQKTFSIEDSKYGSRYIYEEIAHFLLEDWTDTEKCKAFVYHCKKIKSAFPKAISYLESPKEEDGEPQIGVLKDGAINHLTRITIDSTLPNAKEDDCKRTKDHVRHMVNAAKGHVLIAHPPVSPELNKSARRLLTWTESSGESK